MSETDINTTCFHQITLDEYIAAKQEIADRLRNIAEDFVTIGFRLRQIKDAEAYRQEGYTSINDFAKKEYGLSESTVSRFIAINMRFSEGGYSDRLLSEYVSFGSGKLSEMLTLSDEDCRLITEKTTIATIREIKKFNRDTMSHSPDSFTADMGNEEIFKEAETQAQETAVSSEKSAARTYSDFEKVIIEFFRNERELLNDIYRMSDYESIADTINPSGSRSYRKGIYLLLMYGYGEGLILKKMGGAQTAYTWQQFIEATVEIYKETYTDHETVWENYYKPETTANNTAQAETQTKEEIHQTETEKTEETQAEMPTQENAEPEPEAAKQKIPDKPVKTKEEQSNEEQQKNDEAGKSTSKEHTVAGSSKALAISHEKIPHENNILSLRKWYLSNRHMSLDMGVKQEITDMLYKRTTFENIERITEFIENLTVEYTAYVYKNMGNKEQ